MTELNILDSFHKQAYEKNIPWQASLELTNRCNHLCKHCYVDKSQGTDLGLEEWKIILEKLRGAGTLYIVFLGGEALLHPDFFQILEYAHLLNFHTSVITNGYLIDSLDYVKKLELAGLNNITLSLYSTKEKLHDELTGVSGACQKIMQVLEYLKETKIRVGINTLQMAQNIEEYFSICEFATNHKLDFNSDPVVTCDVLGKKHNLAQRPTCEQLQKHFKDKASKWPQSLARPVPLSLCAPICNMARCKCAINHQGDLLPCVEIREVMGNLLREDFHKIWMNKLAQKWRSLENKEIKNLFKDSTDEFLDICPGMGLNEMHDPLVIPEYMKMLAQVQKNILDEFRETHLLPFEGRSMSPLFRDQDELIINFSPKNAQVGDIVFVCLDGESVAHRLIEAGAKNILKGDRSLHSEEIRSEDILGIVEGFIRNKKEYKWGYMGMPFKRIISACSKKTLFQHAQIYRKFYFLVIFVLIQFSVLSVGLKNQLSSKHHT